MIASTVLCFLDLKNDVEFVKEQIVLARDLVSEGRYLIFVYEAPTDWESHIPFESIIINNTLGDIYKRSLDWEFFGNGAIRAYTSKSFKLSKTYQWTILRKVGLKPYSRRKELSTKFLKDNVLPVSDKVFTRDVANNVWHLDNKLVKERIIARFAALLVWQDENFIVVERKKITNIESRTSLDLTEDLVGVPKKIEYFFDNGSKLF